jgi:hypothetical protein
MLFVLWNSNTLRLSEPEVLRNLDPLVPKAARSNGARALRSLGFGRCRGSRCWMVRSFWCRRFNGVWSAGGSPGFPVLMLLGVEVPGALWSVGCRDFGVEVSGDLRVFWCRGSRVEVLEALWVFWVPRLRSRGVGASLGALGAEVSGSRCRRLFGVLGGETSELRYWGFLWNSWC